MDEVFVSIVMPVYNEEKYIVNCIDSLLKQDYSQNLMEWIFVDGMSSDNTKQLIQQYIEKYPTLIKVYDNPNKTVPYAMNIGIGNAKGKYIIRLDAHADYSKNYISKCVYYLNTTNADNVGGIAETKSTPVVIDPWANESDALREYGVELKSMAEARDIFYILVMSEYCILDCWMELY